MSSLTTTKRAPRGASSVTLRGGKRVRSLRIGQTVRVWFSRRPGVYLGRSPTPGRYLIYMAGFPWWEVRRTRALAPIEALFPPNEVYHLRRKDFWDA